MIEGQFFFTAVAGLALSLAGFGSLIAWLREDATRWDPINLWRVKNIVREAFTIVFLALALIPIYTLTEDVETTIRIASVGWMLSVVRDVVTNRERDPAIWQPEISWTVYMVGSALYFALHAVNLWLASLGLLQIAFLVSLASPAGIFSNFVRELGARGRTSDSEAA